MVGAGGGVGLGNRVVATLRADMRVYPTNEAKNMERIVNLGNYKIRTEQDVDDKFSAVGGGTIVMDMGKQLLQYTRDSDAKGVQLMLARGAPFTPDWLGMSALHLAVMNNQYEISVLLLNAGINKDSKTKVDRTPLHFACYYGNERIVELLLQKKCVVNPRDILSMTPLHWAVEKRHKQIVRLLLAHDADVTVTSKFGRTPIGLAVATEQADLMVELELAKREQLNRKKHQENEREITAAVNAIMDIKTDVDAELLTTDGDIIEGNDFSKIDFESINEAGILDSNAINMLANHGISMISDEDSDAPNMMLNTALQNGRQLVLSEGGKMLLNDSLKKSGGSVTSPARVEPRIRSNGVNNIKPNNALLRDKNIRIISLNEFKRRYSNANTKTISKLPASMANNARLPRTAAGQGQLETTGGQLVQPQHSQPKKMYLKLPPNAAKVQQQQREEEEEQQLKIPKQEIIEEDDDIIMSEEITLENAAPAKHSSAPETESADLQQTAQINAATAGGGVAVRFIPAKNLARINSVAITPAPKQVAPRKVFVHTPHTTTPTSATTTNTYKSPAVLPVLSVPEICRQLFEMRSQNADLRRKFELAQRERDELRARLDRLESLYLVENTNEEEYTEPS